MDTLQYYPTPPALAARMVATFTQKPFERDGGKLLEPSAGDGALLRAVLEAKKESYRELGLDHLLSRIELNADVMEIDFSKHAALKGMDRIKVELVGLDFLKYEGSLAAYSHLLLNPPFADAHLHILKAWEGLFDGEIVALCNAETLRNPFSKERQQLVRIIEQHGSVEYVEGAFSGSDALRSTEVDVAIVHLTKRADINQEFLQGIFDGLETDRMGATGVTDLDVDTLGHELAIPGDVIDRSILAFRAAVRCMRESVVASVRASHAAAILGETLAQRDNVQAQDKRDPDMLKTIRQGLVEGYEALKDRAWSEVLRSTEVSDRLSSKAIKTLEASFATIKKLDFSKSNILAFLIGIIESQGEMNIEMALDCFDQITRYYRDNTVHYKGWLSNDRHRTAGMRIKTTRFVLPYFGIDYGHTLGYEKLRKLADFDKVFAFLDGKHVSQTVGLANLFESHKDSETWKALRASKRVSGDYFDIRWFPKSAGTLHFFPQRKDLVDRLNRLVGRHRQWLPPQDDLVNEDFWLAYNDAEKFDAELDAALKARRGSSSYDARHSMSSSDPDEAQRASAVIEEALSEVLQRHGLQPQPLLESTRVDVPQLPLQDAA